MPGGSVPVMDESSGTRGGPARAVRPGAVEPGNVQLWAGGWRRLALACGMLVYPLITAATVRNYSSGLAAVVAYVVVAAFCVCYLLAMVAVARFAKRVFWLLLGAMTLLFLLALPLTQEYAFYLCAVILSLATIVLRRRIAPLVAVGAAASVVVPVLASWRDGPGWIQAIMIVFTVSLVYAFAEIARTNHTLVAARTAVAELAAEAERNRIARDLHDLVGHSLTAITVKSNLARRLAEAEDSPAIREIAEIETLSRQALADVRAAVSGYREVTLAGELARGRELLRAAGVTAELPTAIELVEPAQEVFGWAVREGITNVVRHARATRCTVTVSGSAVEIRDDGVGNPASWGNGITGLRERVDALGGSIEAGPLSPHGWRLRVSLENARAA
jgi:two-component system sensor histidine kinase DesK